MTAYNVSIAISVNFPAKGTRTWNRVKLDERAVLRLGEAGSL
jgi:hypothetical protein